MKYARRGRVANPYGYIIAGRTRPHAWSQTEGHPYKDRSEAKRALAERVRAMGRRGDDVTFDAFLTEPKGRKIRKTRIRVPGYAPVRRKAANSRMGLRTKSTKSGWTKTGKNEYRHIDGHKVKKVGFIWEVSGPNKNDGHRYSTLWAAMDAAAKTPARFMNPEHSRNPVYFYRHKTPGKGRKIRKTRIRVPGYAPNPKLRPFPTSSMGAAPYYSVWGRQYDDYSTAKIMAEKLSQESGKPVSIMKKDDDYLPAYQLHIVESRPSGMHIDDTRADESWLSHKKKKHNPDVRLHWTAQYGHKYDPRQQRSVPDLRQRAAWWRTGIKKPKDVRRAVSKAHKYALKQKDWVKHRVTVEKNPRRRNRKPAKRRGCWAKRRPRNAKGRFVKIKKRSSKRKTASRNPRRKVRINHG